MGNEQGVLQVLCVVCKQLIGFVNGMHVFICNCSFEHGNLIIYDVGAGNHLFLETYNICQLI